MSIVPDLQKCAKNGIQLFMSFGGATSTYNLSTGIASNGKSNAYNLGAFFAGEFFSGVAVNPVTKAVRPFGTFKFDGVDLDLERPFGVQAVSDFVLGLRSLNSSKIITASPQCFRPLSGSGDANLPDSVLTNTTAKINEINVQFYNNPGCQITANSFAKSYKLWQTTIKKPINVAIPASSSSASMGAPNNSTFLKTQLASISTVSGTYPNAIAVWDVGEANFHIDPSTGLQFSQAIQNVINKPPF
ncbi:hypothetical protein HDU76_009207 [Blyttiomyces sp. JEL0837]|nr:hypothetical protein HDU76_009207 [Blyttiomyces sp. JEL0837]